MTFPLDVRFKILTLVPQLYITDAGERPIAYVRKKFWAFKEDVTVFNDDTMSTPRFRINADRVIDFRASYRLSDTAGQMLGVVRRKGARSLWRATYEILVGDTHTFTVTEQSVLVRFIDLLLGEIPVIGLLTGYFLNPAYVLTREGGGEAVLMTKRRSFFESNFKIEKTGQLNDDEQVVVALALMMIIFLERSRG
jgi:hypothetical protein